MDRMGAMDADGVRKEKYGEPTHYCRRQDTNPAAGIKPPSAEEQLGICKVLPLFMVTAVRHEDQE